LFSHFRIGLPNDLFPSGFAIITPYTPLLFPRTCYMPRPSHSSWFHHSNSIWWRVQIRKLLIMQSPPHSSLCSSEVNNAWKCTSTAACIFLAWFLMQNRDKFTFLCLFYSAKVYRTASIC
jgi:hypothetical protein